MNEFPSTQRKAFNGLALVVVRSIAGKTGKITVAMESDGLKASQIELTAIQKKP